MLKTKPFIVVSALTFFSCCGVVYWYYENAMSPPESGDGYATVLPLHQEEMENGVNAFAQSAVEELEKSLHALADSQRQINRRLQALEERASPQALTIEPQAPTIDEQVDNTPTDETPAPDPITIFDDVYLSETRDGDWSYAAETMLNQALNAIQTIDSSAGPQLVECLTTLCKVAYTLAAEEQFEDTLDLLSHSLSWETRAYAEYSVNDDGQVHVVSYYMRENYDYPVALAH